MEKIELVKQAELELQWLRYYANSETRNSFDPTKSPYNQLISIGYTKRVLPLEWRCVFSRLTSKTPLRDTPIEEIFETTEPRDVENNIFSALEVFMIKYPDELEWVTQSLQG